jgi:hypothetical protein
MVDPGDSTGMIEHMTRLVRYPGLRHRLGAAGRIRCRALFTVERMVCAYQQLMLHVVPPTVLIVSRNICCYSLLLFISLPLSLSLSLLYIHCCCRTWTVFWWTGTRASSSSGLTALRSTAIRATQWRSACSTLVMLRVGPGGGSTTRHLQCSTQRAFFTLYRRWRVHCRRWPK